EVVEHGVHGLLAADTDAFVEHIVRLMREPALRAEMSAHAQKGLECFGWDQAIERHMKVYELAVQRHREGESLEKERLASLRPTTRGSKGAREGRRTTSSASSSRTTTREPAGGKKAPVPQPSMYRRVESDRGDREHAQSRSDATMNTITTPRVNDQSQSQPH